MEEVGTQMASPLFIGGPFCGTKRDLSFNSNTLPSQINHHPSWNHNDWEWDTTRFIAKPKPKPTLETTSPLETPYQAQTTTSRPIKKIRLGSPPSGPNSPLCQVDNCSQDLSKAKDYHRRHKVCEFHSKSTKALVSHVMQRFCQQCSRFHPLSEFDEGKRSCRRRLAGHNKRRRKTTQSDDTPPPPPPPPVQPSDNNKSSLFNLDIVNLLTALTRGQGNSEKKFPTCSSVPNKNQLIQMLSKINSLPLSTNITANSGTEQEQGTMTERNLELNSTPKSTTNLLAALSERTSSYSYHSRSEDSDTRINLPLQLFSSSPREDSSPNFDSNNTTQERSHSSSTPITRNLFPLETSLEIAKPVSIPFNEKASVNIEDSPPLTFGSKITQQLFDTGNNRVPSNSLSPQPGYTSSGSDHSPPSFNSDPQKDRTGRIMFKLFDKDPSHFPGALRTQIYNWLSNSPSEMESYIRPGCVVLSIYLSMSSASWEQFEENFLQRVETLVNGSNFDFWRSGRFSVNMGRQLAIHKDGRIRICKPWSTVSSPELFMVSPLAIVNGEETTLLLKGRNLTFDTKVHCSYMGGYSLKEVLRSPYQGSPYEEIILSNFKVHSVPSSVFGRCFIEVENGVRGNSFPIIIADSKICQELRLLEGELNEPKVCSHEEVLHFLNELGWLFQRQIHSDIALHDFALPRFQYLLISSTERDYCALVKKLLDIFVEVGSTLEGLSTECMEAIVDMRLLHRAVKKRSRNMVEMLVHYYVMGSSKKYIFPPNLRGPGGITPLHLAACSSGSYDIVDLLTDDPMQIGLHSWRFILDDSGQSPYSYASMRNDHELNTLVAQKLANRKNSHVSINLGSEILDSSMPENVRQRPIIPSNTKQNSCSKCAMMSYNRVRGSQGFLHRPFIHSMLAIAAVCVCVCVFFHSLHVNSGNSSTPFMWENVEFGAI